MTTARLPMDLKTSGKVSLVLFIILLIEGLFVNLFVGREAANDPTMERCISAVRYAMPALSAFGIAMALGLVMGRPWARRGMIAVCAGWITFIGVMGLAMGRAVLSARPDRFAPGTGRDEALVVLLFAVGAFTFLIALAIRHFLRAGRAS